MKTRSDPYKLFFYAVVFATLAVGLLEGVGGQKWAHAYKPAAQFFVGIIMICLGPALIATALNARASENTMTIWKKTWPVTFVGGIFLPVGGVAMLWKLFAR